MNWMWRKIPFWAWCQKLLMPSLETENENAEKFCMESLKMIPEKEGKDGESITIYGIEPDSKYVEADFSGLSENGVLLSDGFPAEIWH